jgi:hypothetical protein
VAGLVQVPLDGGGVIVVRSGTADADVPGSGLVRSGPVAAGRVGELVDGVVETASCSLREALEPVTRLSQQVLDQLREARPRELTVEFGVELTAQAGAVLAKAGTGCHLTVTLTWVGDGL